MAAEMKMPTEATNFENNGGAAQTIDPRCDGADQGRIHPSAQEGGGLVDMPQATGNAVEQHVFQCVQRLVKAGNTGAGFGALVRTMLTDPVSSPRQQVPRLQGEDIFKLGVGCGDVQETQIFVQRAACQTLFRVGQAKQRCEVSGEADLPGSLCGVVKAASAGTVAVQMQVVLVPQRKGEKPLQVKDEIKRPACNALNVTPRDLVAILQAIKDAGALNAKLRIL